MRAVRFSSFATLPELVEVDTPTPSPRGVVVRVEATGLCRSDWHAWAGHDDGITLPHIPGHELVGTIESVGAEVRDFAVGQRVTVPFVCGCGRCAECLAGNAQVCPNQTQPGFTHDGSYAEFVALHDADFNLIAVPDGVDAGAAALLGCRFATSYRGLVSRAGLVAGESLVVIGCGGVGLSAVMIGVALGATVIAVDVSSAALEAATELGAAHVIDSSGLEDDEVVTRIRSLTESGAHVSVEALGRENTTAVALRSLGLHGRHVQIGLFAEPPRVPLGAVIAGELTVLGSHGMAAADYPPMLELVASGALRPERLIARRITLAEAPAALAAMGSGGAGVTVIEVRRP